MPVSWRSVITHTSYLARQQDLAVSKIGEEKTKLLNKDVQREGQDLLPELKRHMCCFSLIVLVSDLDFALYNGLAHFKLYE